MARRLTDSEFMARFGPPDPITGCREWIGSRTAKGYGSAMRHGRSQLVHRVAFEIAGGAVTLDRPCVLHHCDNPPCGEPTHLYAGTNADNVRDREMRGRNNIAIAIAAAAEEKTTRTHCRRGHPYSGDNLLVLPRGRGCRECERLRKAA